jgi:hypothetical protein
MLNTVRDSRNKFIVQVLEDSLKKINNFTIKAQ